MKTETEIDCLTSTVAAYKMEYDQARVDYERARVEYDARKFIQDQFMGDVLMVGNDCELSSYRARCLTAAKVFINWADDLRAAELRLASLCRG